MKRDNLFYFLGVPSSFFRKGQCSFIFWDEGMQNGFLLSALSAVSAVNIF